MPKGSVTLAERVKRLTEIKKLADSGVSDVEIADQLGMTLASVKRAHKYLKEIAINELSPEEVAAKRIELDGELVKAAEEARKMFENYRDGVELRDKNGKVVRDENGNPILVPKPSLARDFHIRWVSTLMDRAKLYGLDNIKIESFTQINTQHNTYVGDNELSEDQKNKIADIIVGQSG